MGTRKVIDLRMNVANIRPFLPVHQFNKAFFARRSSVLIPVLIGVGYGLDRNLCRIEKRTSVPSRS